MKNKYFILIILLIYFFTSCNTIPIKQVFWGFELGKGFEENRQKLNLYVKSGIFKLNKDNYPYLVNSLPYHNEYYSAPHFLTIPGDTIVAEIQVIYLTNLNNLKTDMEYAQDNSTCNMNIEYHYNKIFPSEIREDIINNIKKTYGDYDTQDTILYQGLKEITKWKNKDGIDITLRYWNDPSFDNRTSIVLTYAYVDDIKEKLLKNKTGY
jgi:hypothetical protein